MNDRMVQLRMPKQLRKAADRVAQADRRTFSDWARLLIEREVKAYEEKTADATPEETPEVPA